VGLSLLVIVVVFGLKRHPPATPCRRAFVGAVVVASVWLTVPALQIVAEHKQDYHVHRGNFRFGRSVHVTPFWPRYWTLLMGRPWPGDYVCPLPPEVSMPPTYPP
jgi:hypothetical protein